MFRSLFAAALLGSTALAAAQAQTFADLPIAYVKGGGSGAAIYLTNDTGSQTVKIYSTPSKAAIPSIDLKPQGGEIAFVELRNGRLALKVLTFGSSQPRTITTQCAPHTVDYHPGGATLIIADGCSDHVMISTVGTDGTGYQVLRDGVWFDSPRWLRDGTSYVYARAVDANGQQLCRNGCDSSGGELLWSGPQVGRMDVGRAGDDVLFDRGTSYLSKVNALTGELQSNMFSGIGGHFSPDDTRILYTTPHSKPGDYLQIRNANGLSTRITDKGTYAVSDWRP
jgi:Tol biopolymer transport system component